MTFKESMGCIYGKKSHLSVAGKILIGIPMLPFVLMMFGTYYLLDALFTKKDRP